MQAGFIGHAIHQPEIRFAIRRLYKGLRVRLLVLRIKKLWLFSPWLNGNGAMNHPAIYALIFDDMADERIAKKPKGFVFRQWKGISHVSAHPAIGPFKLLVP